jgi:glutamate dehydrogenase
LNAPEKTYIDRLLTRLQNKLAPDHYPLIATFARLFWARTLEEDLASRGVSNDAGATIEAWRRLCDRQGDDIHIHLINPVSARDGWQSSHSIVIVVAPNMPFMV